VSLQNGWRSLPLGEVLKLSSGKTKPPTWTPEKDAAARVPVYGGNGINGYCDQIYSDQPVIVIGRVGEYCGCVHLVREPAWITDNALYTKEFSSGENDLDYFAYLLKYKDLSKLRSKGGQPLVSQGPIHGLICDIPPLREQKKIAEILSTWDRAIELLSADLARMTYFKLGLLRRIIYKNQFHPSKGWRLATIGELFDILDSRRKPLNSTQRAELNGTVPYYGANGCVGFVDTHIFDEPLILLAEDGGNFDQYRTRPIAYRVEGKSWVNNHAHVLRAKPDFNQDYLYFAFVHKNIIPFLNGGTRAKLNKSALEEIELPVPETTAMQEKIANYFNSIEGLIEKTSKQKSLLEKQKQGLMQKLLTGKVRVKV
jgi:type I restriction enzyme, S subunit